MYYVFALLTYRYIAHFLMCQRPRTIHRRSNIFVTNALTSPHRHNPQAHHKALREHDDVQHVLFDYHAQVRGNNTKALETLKRNLQPTLQHQGFFFTRGDEVYM